jgi:tRNA (mo5U34)-methyltransferase
MFTPDFGSRNQSSREDDMIRNPFFCELPLGIAERTLLKEYIEENPKWFHHFEFEGGLTTPGLDPSYKKLHHLCLPQDLSGLTVLDIGAFDGYFSFHAKHRNADRVVAADKYVWELPEITPLQNLRKIKELTGAKIEEVLVDVPTSHALINEQFDIVLFLGVLYHAPNMIDYLSNVAKVTKQMCIVETVVDNLASPFAGANLYAAGELNNDASNWWGPNLKAVEIMLHRVGFRRVEFMNIWDINTIEHTKGNRTLAPVQSGRAVFHAYR